MNWIDMNSRNHAPDQGSPDLDTKDWTKDQASNLYTKKRKDSSELEISKVFYEDCVHGMKRLPSDCIDLVVADPPFGIDFTSKESMYARKNEFVVEGYQEVMTDYFEFTMAWLSELPRIMKQTSTAYVFSGWNNLEYVLRAARQAGLKLINHIIWHYQFGPFTQRKFATSHYHNLMLVKNPENYYFHEFEIQPEDVWVIPRRYRHGQKKNITAMPIELISRCIDFSTRPGDIVLDPFMGNGTTAMSAKANFRHFIGFELNSDLKPIIDHNLQMVQVGQDYIPYGERNSL
ncbi:MAG: DNA-methyltransferase [Candidatus Thorarchaeota archaeon]